MLCMMSTCFSHPDSLQFLALWCACVFLLFRPGTQGQGDPPVVDEFNPFFLVGKYYIVSGGTFADPVAIFSERDLGSSIVNEVRRRTQIERAVALSSCVYEPMTTKKEYSGQTSCFLKICTMENSIME